VLKIRKIFFRKILISATIKVQDHHQKELLKVGADEKILLHRTHTYKIIIIN